MLGSLIKALADVIHMAINAFILVIIIRSVISWMGNIPPNRFIFILRRLTDPIFRFVHRNLPFTIVGGIDISPIIIIFALYFVDRVLYDFLIGLAVQLKYGSLLNR